MLDWMCSAEEALSLRLYGYFGTTIKPMMTITMANPNHTPRDIVVITQRIPCGVVAVPIRSQMNIP